MPILETAVEKHGVEYAKKLNYIVFKVSPAGQRGWPDRVFINEQGLHVYVEFKRPGEKLRKLQIYRCGTLRERNVIVYSGVDTKQEIEDILNEHMDSL